MPGPVCGQSVEKHKGPTRVGPWRPDPGSPIPASRLKIVSDPQRELRLAESAAPALRREQHVLPVLVEERLPRPIEMDREADEEGLEADAVRGARVDQPEAVDYDRLSQHRQSGQIVIGDRTLYGRTTLQPGERTRSGRGERSSLDLSRCD